jgi:tRNA-specific 2-thiouridylase
MEKKALVAMSGGVDSSVAAYLMQKDGYTCIGAMMKLISNKLSEKCHLENSTGQTCCSLDDAEDARSVAYRLGFLFYVFDFSEDFEKNVIEKFVNAYETGFTPNPCLECNRFLKFDRLYRRAQELGCDTLVTGHYARIDHENGRYLLKKGVDPKKDQSYFLYSMTQDQLGHTRFPLGVMHKEEIRRIAEEQGFVNAHKPDSQDICFVPDGDYAAFLETYTGKTYPEGNFIGTDGTVLGTHRGAVRFTIGQRKGLGIALGSPMYVTAKDMTENTVTLAPNEALFTDELTADELNWISVEELTGPLRVQAKIRYRHTEQPALITPAGSGQVHVKFDEPQRAITPGQAVVFYNGDTVVGGGRILR